MFGLSLYTTERDLREVFSKYGPLSAVNIVYDQQSRRSRGFAFVYFENNADSKEVNKTRIGSSKCSVFKVNHCAITIDMDLKKANISLVRFNGYRSSAFDQLHCFREKCIFVITVIY